jgi:predicted amidophosphoribosyltransferase
LVLPPTCRLCNQPVGSEQDFCGPCERNLTLSEPMMQSACHRCGRPRPKTQSLVTRGEKSASDVESCVQCEREKLAFSPVVPLWSYQDRVCEAIVAAKYGHQSPLGAALGRRLGKKLVVTLGTELPDLISLVTFVPSHFTRHFQRGGNGNRAIADAVCDCLREKNRPVRCRSLLRMTRRIKKQAWLNNEQRRGNVRDAFALKKSYVFAKSLVDQHILLVDDVLTTGATASEVARVLLDGGARRVTLAVVARAIRSQ